MTLFELYTNLRKEVLKQISGVEDSNGYFSWDNTTPNYLIKNRLESLLADYITKSKDFGIYVVTRYASCARSAHEGYPTENRYGLEIPYQDEKFVWGADQIFQGERISTCPCSNKNKPHKNHVIDDIIYKKSANEKDCKLIASIFCDISEAISNATDKKARSGIREHLLRAILKLNDAVLPMPVDEYISTVLRKNT